MARGGRRPGAGRKKGTAASGKPQDEALFVPKRGRPSSYDPAYCEQIIAFCEQGFSITAFAGTIGVGRQTITDWAKAHEEFSLAVHTAKAAASFWWEQRSRRVAEHGGGPGTATVIMFNLKNTAPDDYREKVEHAHGNADDKPFKTQNDTTVRPDLKNLDVDQLRTLEGIVRAAVEPRGG